MPRESAARRRGLLFVLGATVLWSLAGYFARLLAHLDLGTVLFGRAGFGALCIASWAVFEHRRGVLGARFGFGPLSPLIVLLSATAISTYIAAVMTTTVADVLVIYATIGVVIMVANGLGSGRLLGQALSMLMTVTFALMVVLQRRDPSMSMTSINAAAAVLASAFGYGLSAHPALDGRDLVILFLFGLTTVCVAFVMFMEGAKFVPSAEAGLISMLDVALGPLWVFLAFGENPGPATLLGGAFVIGAVIWRVIPEITGPPPAQETPSASTTASWPL